MKYNLLMILLAGIIFSCNNEAKNPVLVENKNDNVIYTLDSNILSKVGKSALEIYIMEFSDSLNNSENGSFPFFLFDTQFDYTHSTIWGTSNDALPLRKLIFDNVSNCEVLSRIINDKINNFKMKPKIQDGMTLDYKELSIYELAKQRSKKLECK